MRHICDTGVLVSAYPSRYKMQAAAVLLIPAYRPSAVLQEIVTRVLGQDTFHDICAVVVVDDGGGPEFRHIFDALQEHNAVTVLRHAVNLGKGAALKTGFNHALLAFPDCAGVVTADADGQHAVPDILHLARVLVEKPDRIALGVRQFGGDVPLRSQLGNTISRYVFLAFTGVRLSDTQTGLRAWPRRYCMASLPIAINGYDFELECLLKAHDEAGQAFSICQVPIKTIYLDGNRGSHFNPLRDSMRIYFVFARYCGASLLAAIIDSSVFYLVFSKTADLVASQISGRTIAIAVVFMVARNLVFRSSVSVPKALAKYLTVATVMGIVSYGMMNYLREFGGVPVLLSKLVAEGLLFVASFSIQRQVVFARPKNGKSEA
jgi:glycosyltransferase involved in cell wall biosynthesis